MMPLRVTAGDEISFGDSALFPTFVFCCWILPSKFGWQSVFAGRPKLEAWWAAVNADPVAQRVSTLAAHARKGLGGAVLGRPWWDSMLTLYSWLAC
jgi:hypothetical protein